MISIILPTYNSSPWLERCLDSVIAQTLTDWELIAIDDGSSDNSAEIIASFATADPRIRLISMEHGGVAQVRNVGIAEARGEYLAFIDSDDLWAPQSLEFLMGMLTDNEAEIACGGFIFFNDTPQEEQKARRECEKRVSNHAGKKVQVMTGTEAVKESLYQRGVNSSLCGKLYRRHTLSALRMNPGEIYEDLDIFYRIAMTTQRIAVSQVPVYMYRQRKGSIIHTFSPSRLDVLYVTKRMHHIIASASPALLDAAIDRRYSANFNMLQEITKYLHSSEISTEEKGLFEQKLKEIDAFLQAYSVKELRDKNVRIKNKIGALLYILLPASLLKLILTKL